MTPAQRETAELLKSLGRPAELIAANTGIPVEIVKAWLKSGKWLGPRQGRLFDPTGYSPRPSTTQPATASQGNHGLRLFAQDPTGKSDTTQATRSGVTP